MNVLWSLDARTDRERIALYIAQFDVDAALRMIDIFEEGGRKLSQLPYLGCKGRVEGTRELVVHKHYFLIYELKDDTVVILNVLHTSQKYPPQ